MSEAGEVLARARSILDAAPRRPPPDYAAANKAFRRQKARLTGALNSQDPDRVVLACRDAVREWSEAPFNGAWPDDWARWQRALDDALGLRNTVRLENL
jgi:hypothetical protein